MIAFIIAGIIGVVGHLIVALVCFPIFKSIRDFIRRMLYLLGIDTFTRKDKLALGIIKEDLPVEKDEEPPPIPEELRRDVISNCILSSDKFPNIGKYRRY